MSANESVYIQHSENTDWTSKLNFYKDEVVILTGRLEEIASKNSGKDALAEVEKYQNQLIVQRNNIDEIAHLVNLNEQALIEVIKSNPVAVDHRKVEYHSKERELVESFETNFNNIREDFNRFASKWM